MYKYCQFCGQGIKFKDSFAQCEGCGKSIYLNSKPTASVIFVFNNRILLCRRGVEPAKGKIDIIGGFLNNGEDPLVGAVREVEEETGYKVDKKNLEYLGTWIDIYRYENGKYYTFNMIYFVRVNEKPKMVVNDDISELVWFDLGVNVDGAFPVINKILMKLAKRLEN